MGLTIVAMALAINWVSRGYLLARFSELGMQFAREDMQRLRNAVSNELDELNSTVWDWSAWDATYAYVQTPNKPYEDGNLNTATFLTLKINLLAIVKTNGEVAWGRVCDLASKTLAPLPADAASQLRPGAPLVDHRDLTGRAGGLIALGGRPFIVCARPILTSANEGPIRGTLVMGRHLDEPYVRHLGRLVGVAAEVIPASAPAAQDLIARATLGAECISVRPRDGGTLEAVTLLDDLHGHPCAVLRTIQVRRIYQMAETAVAYFVLMLVIGCLAIGLTGFLVLERNVVRRLTALHRDVMTMDAAGETSHRLSTGVNDEVGMLAGAFNRLLDTIGRYVALQRNANTQLERRVAERTAALNESQAEIRRLYSHIARVREDERRRAAARVHDDLGQALTVLKMDLARTKSPAPDLPDETRSQLDEALTSIDAMTATMQDIATELRPPMLDHFGLSATLQWSVKKLAERSGIRCELDCDDIDAGHGETAVSLFRISQELLTNVVRHAEASVVFVRLHQRDHHLVLEVEDNGRGIRDADIVSPTAFGLSEVRERVASLAGQLAIQREPDGGTRVVVQVPWPQTTAEEESNTHGKPGSM